MHSTMAAATVAINPPLSPFFKGGNFSVNLQPFFGKEGKGRFLCRIQGDSCSEFLRQDRRSAVINIHSLSKAFKTGADRVQAVDGVDLQVEEKEFFVLLGLSGS